MQPSKPIVPGHRYACNSPYMVLGTLQNPSSLATTTPAARPTCGSILLAGSVSGVGLSYAIVAAFEAAIACPGPGPTPPPKAVPICVSKPLLVLLDLETTEDILNMAEEFSSLAAIFCFQGFWPSLADLHAWISKHWEPFLDQGVQIFPNTRGFYIVKFETTKDEEIILCCNHFSWLDKYPLMAKPWHMDL